MGNPSAVVFMLAVFVSARGLHETVGSDNANLRRELGAALENSRHANSLLESALALKPQLWSFLTCFFCFLLFSSLPLSL